MNWNDPRPGEPRGSLSDWAFALFATILVILALTHAPAIRAALGIGGLP